MFILFNNICSINADPVFFNILILTPAAKNKDKIVDK